MRRWLTTLISVAAIAAMLFPATALGGDDGTRHTADPTASPVVTVLPLVQVRLGCALVRADAPPPADPFVVSASLAPAIACRWTVVSTERVRAYQLWRIEKPGDTARRLIATIPADQPLRYRDVAVSRGHAYTYAVIAIGRDGARIGISNTATVWIAPALERLRLACALATTGDQRGVACKWSEAQHPAAAGYVLWRSVDGGAREAIYKTRLDGRRGFVDVNVKRGQTIRYAVVLVDKDGHRIGQGGPVAVRIPAPAPSPAAVRVVAAVGSAEAEGSPPFAIAFAARVQAFFRFNCPL